MRIVALILGLAIAISTVYRFTKSFSNARVDHGLRIRIHEDCRTNWFASRYEDLCEKDRTNPPGGLLVAVLEEAFFDGNYCVLMDCSLLCSARGAIYGFVGWMMSDLTI